MNMITMKIKITVSFQCVLEAILYSHLQPEMFLYNMCLTYFQGILLTHLVSILRMQKLHIRSLIAKMLLAIQSCHWFQCLGVRRIVL